MCVSLQWLTTLTEERTAWKTWKMICCAFIRSISHISLGPIHFIPRELSKVNTQTSRRDQTGSQQSLKEQVAKKKIQGEKLRRMKLGSMEELTKELTGTLPYALSMCPTTITASLEESEEVATACQVVDANVAMRSTVEYGCTGANHLLDIGSKTQPYKRDLTFLASSSSGGCTNRSEWSNFVQQ